MKNFDLKNVQILELESKYINDILNIEKQLKIHILSKQNVISQLNNPHFKCFIALYEEQVIAYTYFSYIDDIELEAIAVKKDFQRLHVATLLLNTIFDFANKQKIKNIFLEVRKSNVKAINLYTKNGFKKINIRKNYYTDNYEDAIIFQKQIRN